MNLTQLQLPGTEEALVWMCGNCEATFPEHPEGSGDICYGCGVPNETSRGVVFHHLILCVDCRRSLD